MNRAGTASRTLVALALAHLPFAGCAGQVDLGPPSPETEQPQPAPDKTTSSAGGQAAESAADDGLGRVAESGFFIDPEKSLLVRHPAITDNATRTTNPCLERAQGVAPGGTSRVWSFGHLMTQMANGRDPSVFAHNWLANWGLTTRVNGDPLMALHTREDGSTLPKRIFDAWQRASRGT